MPQNGFTAADTSHIKPVEIAGFLSVGILELLEYFADTPREANRDGNSAAVVSSIPIQLRERENFRTNSPH